MRVGSKDISLKGLYIRKKDSDIIGTIKRKSRFHKNSRIFKSSFSFLLFRKTMIDSKS